MRYPKATNSKDGVKRMTINIQYRISEFDLMVSFGEILLFLLDESINDTSSDEIIKKANEITKKEVLDNLKSLLETAGENFTYRIESWPEKLIVISKAKTKRLFPEFEENKK